MIKISNNKLLKVRFLQKCSFESSDPSFLKKRSSYFVLLSKKNLDFCGVFDKKGTLQKISIPILYLHIFIYLLHIGQLQPKRVLQLRQCYKLHMPRVQWCHQWSQCPFCQNRDRWLQHYCYYYTTKSREHVNVRKKSI